MYKIESLTKSHDRERFDCNSEPLNTFLRQTARQHGERGISQTFVLVDEVATAPKPILGYFSLNICQVVSDSLSPADAKKLPRHVSGVRLGRLAVSKDHQRKGPGKILLGAAMEKVMEIFNHAGGIGLFVDAKDPEAKHYYERFGFVSLPTNELELFLPLKTIKDALG